MYTSLFDETGQESAAIQLIDYIKYIFDGL